MPWGNEKCEYVNKCGEEADGELALLAGRHATHALDEVEQGRWSRTIKPRGNLGANLGGINQI